jgi:BirA family biotin operon repressor/biotin-[acetyl-CoA-carboxylase] ligase
MGKNLVYVPHCHSTNTLAAELSQKAETSEGTVVVTSDQTSGRGQRGNSWESEPEKNLTLSLILKPRFLSVQEQFRINEAVTLALADYLQLKSIPDIKIKWPNDILSGETKIGGILIENHISGNTISHSIVGVGLNVNQRSFRVLRACSMALITGQEYHLSDELEILLGCIEARYLELRQGNITDLKNDYLQLLYRRNENHKFKSHELEFQGIILGVDDLGHLRIKIGTEEKSFGLKELRFI